jgi:hypothetical protein
MATLTEEQKRRYEEQGFLLVSGLIPAEVAENAAAALWRHLGADPGDPDSWARISPTHAAFDDPALLACYTPDVLAAAADLAGDDPASFAVPGRAYAINVFPREGGAWEWPEPHIDHAIREHGHRVFPRAFRIAGMAFLNDVPPHGAGTVVWPGSHKKLEALARSDTNRYEMMWALNQDLGKVDLGAPVETTPRRGDVLFYHYLCAHAGSPNTSRQPRLALNMKW